MANSDPFDTQGFGAGDTFNSAPLASGSSTPTARSIDIKGAAKQVFDIAARDAIPGAALARDDADQMRQEGMLVFVQADQTTYQLRAGIANTDWVVFGGGGGSGTTLDIDDRVNQSGGALAIGEILAPHPTIPRAYVKADISDPALGASRPIAVSTAAPVATDPAPSRIAGEVSVLLVPGLLGIGVPVALTDEVIVSTTAGRGTLSKNGPGELGQPTAGQALNKVGTIVSLLTYDGAGDDLVLVQLDMSPRRIQS
jgi:hypothetical protein